MDESMNRRSYHWYYRLTRQIARQIQVRPRLVISGIIGMLVVLVLPTSLATHGITRLIVGWNVGACLYLLLAALMMARSTQDTIQKRACQQDDGQWVILTIVVLASVVSLAAIIAQLVVVKDMQGTLRYAHIGLAALTIVSSWAFTHVMFALHYAHEYYVAVVNGKQGGLDFPGGETPDYGDFVYMAFVIGTSGQTADVSFSSKAMRRVGLVHCVLAFFFNTTVLALTINIAASLF
jgi:uncharacterized membrane protein